MPETDFVETVRYELAATIVREFPDGMKKVRTVTDGGKGLSRKQVAGTGSPASDNGLIGVFADTVRAVDWSGGP